LFAWIATILVFALSIAMILHFLEKPLAKPPFFRIRPRCDWDH